MTDKCNGIFADQNTTITTPPDTLLQNGFTCDLNANDLNYLFNCLTQAVKDLEDASQYVDANGDPIIQQQNTLA